MVKGKSEIKLWFELENHCNLGCKFCYNYWKDGRYAPPSQLSARQLIKCLENLFSVVECSQITLSGGEPLLRNDLFEILEFISAKKIPMVITTNGLLLSGEIVERLLSYGVKTFELPIHAMKPDLHDYLSGKKCFDATVAAFILLKEKRCNVIPVFVATKRNMEEFISIIKFAELFKFERIILNRTVPGGLANVFSKEIGIPTDSEMIELLLKTHKYAEENGIAIHLGVPINVPNHHKMKVIQASCPVAFGQSRWILDSGGNLRRCNHSPSSIGNLLHGGEKILETELLANSSQPCSHSYTCQFLDNEVHKEIQLL